jgi:hypothetical protein
MRSALFTLALAALAGPASVEADENRSHRHQVGFDVTAGSGYRVIFKYEVVRACSNDPKQSTTCTDRLPTWLDVKVFYAFTDNFEVVLEQRFGLEKDFNNTNQLLFMPGIRIYPSGRDAFKFFLQIQGVFDFTEPGNNNWARYDFGLHEANGFQWDFIKWAGVYLQISETFTFLRSFIFQFEGGLGLEGRFP